MQLEGHERKASFLSLVSQFTLDEEGLIFGGMTWTGNGG